MISAKYTDLFSGQLTTNRELFTQQACEVYEDTPSGCIVASIILYISTCINDESHRLRLDIAQDNLKRIRTGLQSLSEIDIEYEHDRRMLIILDEMEQYMSLESTVNLEYLLDRSKYYAYLLYLFGHTDIPKDILTVSSTLEDIAHQDQDGFHRISKEIFSNIKGACVKYIRLLDVSALTKEEFRIARSTNTSHQYNREKAQKREKIATARQILQAKNETIQTVHPTKSLGEDMQDTLASFERKVTFK